MRLGIDFGTTNSSVARFDGTSLQRFVLDQAGDNVNILPSLIYINRGQVTQIGTAAALHYLARETGRVSRWERRVVGEIDYVGADLSYVQTVHVMVDAAAQGRLLQYIKTALRDSRYDGTQVFERFYTVDELVALVLRQLKVSAEKQTGQTSRSVVLGRPVKFSDDPAITARAEEILFKGARLVGFEDIRFELEPIGAAFYYHISVPQRRTAFIFDFGGGTLDLTIARVGGQDAPEILATHGVLVGGDDLDRELMRALRKYFGGGPAVGAKKPLPEYILELLDNWQTMPMLSRPASLKQLEEFRATCVNPKGIDALKILVTRNLGFMLFREIEKTKKQLSVKYLAPLDLSREGLAIHEQFTRREFETLIEKQMAQVAEGVRTTLNLAGMRPAQIDVVLRTGGTSAVPAFTQLLEEIFGDAKLAELDLLTSVVGGLAVVAHSEGGVAPAYRVRYATRDYPIVRNARTVDGRALDTYDFRIGAASHGDQPYVLARLPVELSGLPAIRPAQADKRDARAEFIEFDVERPARVFIAYDARAKTPPTWMQSFTPYPKPVEIDQWGTPRAMRLFYRDVPAGHVTLGGNGAENWLHYSVIIQTQV